MSGYEMDQMERAAERELSIYEKRCEKLEQRADYLLEMGRAYQATAEARAETIAATAAVHTRWAEGSDAQVCMVEIGRILAEAKVVK